MKRILSYSLLIAVLAGCMMMTACSEPDEFEYVDEEIITGKSNDQPSVIVTDENGNTSTLPSGNTIGVYVVDEDGNVTLQQIGVDENGNTVLPASTEESTMIAYTPYQEEWGEDAIVNHPDFTVESNQSTEDAYNASDLMIGTTKTEATTRATTNGSMTFRHMLAKVAIHIVDETGRVDLTRIATELLNVKDCVTVDLAHQQVETKDDSQRDVKMFWEMTTDWRISYYAIVAPQSIAEGTDLFAVMLYGNREIHPIPEAATLESGKTYTINMRLTEHGLIPDGWYITDWNEEAEQDIDINIK